MIIIVDFLLFELENTDVFLFLHNSLNAVYSYHKFKFHPSLISPLNQFLPPCHLFANKVHVKDLCLRYLQLHLMRHLTYLIKMIFFLFIIFIHNSFLVNFMLNCEGCSLKLMQQILKEVHIYLHS